MTWLQESRVELAIDRILDAVGRQTANLGPGVLAMDAVAQEAGCSRATLYRYFANRHALLTAYAHRQAFAILKAVADDIADLDDLTSRATEGVLSCLRQVRADPQLLAWYGVGDSRLLAELLGESSLLEAITAGAISPENSTPDLDLARWVMRATLSLLAVPGADPDEERRLVTRFLAPHMSL